MKVLVVTKPTNLEQHGAAVRAMEGLGRSSTDLLTELKAAHAEHYQSLDALRKALTAAGIAYSELPRGDIDKRVRDVDAIFTVGGDGTLLSASRMVTDRTPLIGIRSSHASVGYLCASGHDQIADLVDSFRQGSLRLQEVSRLQAIIEQSSENLTTTTLPVLNDFLFANANPAATTRYKLQVGTQVEVHKSSGVWVSTAMGSTAANLAAGGKAMELSDGRFQFVVREPYKEEGVKLGLTHGFFNPDLGLVLSIENHSENALIALDGQRETIALRYGDRIRFIRAPAILLARTRA